VGNGALKTDIIEVEEGTDSFTIVRSPDNRPAKFIFKRFISEIIDYLIVSLLFFPLQIITVNISSTIINWNPKIFGNKEDVINLGIFLLTFIFTKSIYYYFLYRHKCTTLGKKFFHFRVYRTNTQEPIGIIRIIIREFIGKLLTLIFLPLSLAWYLFDDKARFPHDFLGGTMVVEELKEHNGIEY